eukprot:jgi/Tetstr1/454941/TSEL_041802.t1
MHAYSADMEGAWREAPADIEWPELDGHRGIDPGEAFAEAVDATTVLTAVERVLGVSFDPSTYGTDTNAVVTDFQAGFLHDLDPTAAETATLSEDALARARSRLHLPPHWLKVGRHVPAHGIRRMATVRDAAFIGCMNDILPRFFTRNSDTNTPTHGFCDPQVESVLLGRGSFNANSSAHRYDHYLDDDRGSASYATEVREAWGRLQEATVGHLSNADADDGAAEREAEAASGSQTELTGFLDHGNNSRLRNEVAALPVTCGVRIFSASSTRRRAYGRWPSPPGGRS